MNKKGILGYVNAASIFAIMALIIFFIFLSSGGATAVYKIGAFVGSLPTIFWAIMGIFILAIFLRGK